MDEKKVIEYLTDMQAYLAREISEECDEFREAQLVGQKRFVADMLDMIDRGDFV